MLKRIFQLFKTDGHETPPDFSGSYLDYLLSTIELQVRAELEACPGHDPLLLTIAEILRASMPGVWHDGVRRPLVESSGDTPPPVPGGAPPPPAPGGLDEDSEIDDFEEFEDSDILTEELDFDGESLGESSSAGATQGERPRLDEPQVLQAGRVYLGMLIENDRLPPMLQLGLSELVLSRDLLIGYFVGAQRFEDKASQLLRVIEEKFSESLFSQARILLGLFQAERATRIRNDRNIFYEDMIQRLGIRRRHAVSAERVAERDALGVEGRDQMIELARWYADALSVQLHTLGRAPEAVDAWTELGALADADASELLRFVPPRRWRPLAEREPGTIDAALAEHAGPDAVSAYVVRQMRTCYFVLRAPGNTGLESYLDAYFDWMGDALDFDATLILPEIYRRSMGEFDAMGQIFQDLYDVHLREKVAALLADLTEERRADAADRAAHALLSAALDQVPPGNYDLGGFLFDALFSIEYPTPEFAFKIHRLT